VEAIRSSGNIKTATSARLAPTAAAAIAAPPSAAHRPLLSLIIPAYNEGARIAPSLAEAAAYLAASGLDYEIIVVNDGSTDGTAALIERLSAGRQDLRLVSYEINRGKGHAIRAGVAAARGDYIMFTDADLSIPIAITAEFLGALRGGYDIAIASRWHPRSSNAVPPPLRRRVMGGVFRWCVRRLVVSDVRDTQCGCKAYRADVARNLFARQRIDRFSFDAEVIFLAARAGYRIKEVPFALRHTPGSSVRPLRDSTLMLRDLLRIRLNAMLGRYSGLVRGASGGDRDRPPR
jgi:glycosyltransferase involved in cell wall biosynthesis